MRAFVTSIGESTTDLCVWALERQGFEVTLVKSVTSLANKLSEIFQDLEEDILRVDADVIVNRNVKQLVKEHHAWWYQGLTYDWWKQDVANGGVQFIRKEALPAIKKHMHEAERRERPETYLSRLAEFHQPRQFLTVDYICGLNGFKQYDPERVKATKLRRDQYQDYDWELAERLNQWAG